MKKVFSKGTIAIMMASAMAGSVVYAGDIADYSAYQMAKAEAEKSVDGYEVGVSEYDGTGVYDGMVVEGGQSGIEDTTGTAPLGVVDTVGTDAAATTVDTTVASANATDTLVAQPDVTSEANLTSASVDASILDGTQTADPELIASVGEAVSTGNYTPETVSGNDVSAAAGAGIIADTVPEDMADDPLDTDEGGEDYGYTILGIAQVNDHLNVRKTADDNSDLVGKMEGDAGCEIIEVVGNKAHISSGNVEGYVSLDYLLTGDEAKTYAQDHIKKIATVTADGLKIRYSNDINAPVMALVGYNEDFEVLEENVEGGWVKISYDKKEGFVKSEYVKVGHKLKTALSMKELRKGNGVSDRRIALCEYAKQFLGNRYVWGGTSLTKGCDCSGYVLSLYAKYGVYLPHSSRAQAQMGTKISMDEVKPGDLVFYAKGGRINHVAMYIGGGQVIHASSPKLGIRITSAYYRKPVAVRRYFSD